MLLFLIVCQINLILYNNNQNMYMFSIPASICVSPVKNFVHGRHAVPPHRCYVTTGHDCIVHPRMHCQLLLEKKRNASQLGKVSLSMCITVFSLNHLVTKVYLGKESFARSRRPVHEDVPVEAVVLPCVSCCYGNITHTLFQGRLRDF